MKIKENLILLIFIVLVLGGGYYWYEYIRSPVLTGESFTDAEVFGREFLSMAARMKRIQISADFLQSSAFVFLKDLTPIIEMPEMVGRPNPFLPIVGDSELDTGDVNLEDIF
jgi:hypothetical protein